jgi:predicted nucleic acid-binding protein
VLPFDMPAARLYGTMAALVKRSGREPRPRRMDLQIAATAAAKNADGGTLSLPASAWSHLLTVAR